MSLFLLVIAVIGALTSLCACAAVPLPAPPPPPLSGTIAMRIEFYCRHCQRVTLSRQGYSFPAWTTPDVGGVAVHVLQERVLPLGTHLLIPGYGVWMVDDVFGDPSVKLGALKPFTIRLRVNHKAFARLKPIRRDVRILKTTEEILYEYLLIPSPTTKPASKRKSPVERIVDGLENFRQATYRLKKVRERFEQFKGQIETLESFHKTIRELTPIYRASVQVTETACTWLVSSWNALAIPTPQ